MQEVLCEKPRVEIICGDCRDIMKTLPPNSVDTIITDPPYNISQEGKEIKRSYKHYNWKRESNIKQDFGKWDKFDTEKDFFDFTVEWAKEAIRVLKEKGWIYVFFDKQKLGYWDLFIAPMFGLKSRCVYVWIKSNPVPSFCKINWVSATEFCYVGSKGASKIKNFKFQKEMNNYFITPNKSSYGQTSHPTEKPVTLFRHLVEVNSNKGDIVLDPFLGSGTTGVTCKETGRNFIGIEMNKEYYEIAKRRIKATQTELV